jgi:hypothetical protein
MLQIVKLMMPSSMQLIMIVPIIIPKTTCLPMLPLTPEDVASWNRETIPYTVYHIATQQHLVSNQELNYETMRQFFAWLPVDALHETFANTMQVVARMFMSAINQSGSSCNPSCIDGEILPYSSMRMYEPHVETLNKKMARKKVIICRLDEPISPLLVCMGSDKNSSGLAG